MNKELIRQARQADLAEYLIRNGEPLERNGSRYRHKEHNSLVFTKNAYYWNSKSETGNAIDYLMRHKGMDFAFAIEELTGEWLADGEQSKDASPSTKQGRFEFDDIKLSLNMSRTFAYLHKSRGIDYALVQRLVDSKLLFQEQERNNMIFPIVDEHGKVVGAERAGTITGMKFKGIAEGSKYGYGFNVNPTNNDQIKYLLFFEGAIDLLSFWQIKSREKKGLDNCLFISMAGLKDNIVKNMLDVAQKRQNYPVRAFLCVDNDEAGDIFIKTLMAQIQGIEARLPHPEYKDWNEQLIAIQQKK